MTYLGHNHNQQHNILRQGIGFSEIFKYNVFSSIEIQYLCRFYFIIEIMVTRGLDIMRKVLPRYFVLQRKF